MENMNYPSVKRIDLESYFGDSANVSLAKTSLLYNENVISTKDVEKSIVENTFFMDERIVVIPTVMAERLENSVAIIKESSETSNAEAV